LEQGAKVQSSPLNVAPLVPNVEPLLHAPPRPSGFNNDHLASDRPSIGRRIFRALARFFIAVLIGVGATLAWQSHGDDAKTDSQDLGSFARLAVTRLDDEVTPRRSGFRARCGTSPISACHSETSARFGCNIW
jgi:hypothetical protein